MQPSVWKANPPEVVCVVGSHDDIPRDLAQNLRDHCHVADTLECCLSDMRSVIVKFLARQHIPPQAGATLPDRSSRVNNVTSVSRIFIPNITNLAANYGFTDQGTREIVQFMLGIKQLVRDLHATLAFTIPSQSCPFALTSRLKWTADTILSVDSFAGREQTVPYEFKEFCGLLTIERVQQVGSIASFRPPGSRFGLKRDSRKLHIELLHLPPEESRTGKSGTVAAAILAEKDGFAAPQATTAYDRTKIEIKHEALDTSVVSQTILESNKTDPIFTSSHGEPIKPSPSKYEEKGIFDGPEVNKGNQAARSIFARARAEGLLPASKGFEGQQQRDSILPPGSSCAPSKPGVKSLNSLEF